MDELEGKLMPTTGLISSNGKEADHERGINRLERVVLVMKAQMDAGTRGKEVSVEVNYLRKVV